MPSENGAKVPADGKGGTMPVAGALAVAAVGLVCLAAVLTYLGGSGGWGVDGSLRLDQLTAEQRVQVCAGMLADRGGEGRTASCPLWDAPAGRETTVTITTPTRAQCLDDPLFTTACTVSALESCYRGADACGATAGDCAALRACAALMPSNAGDMLRIEKDTYRKEVLESTVPVVVLVSYEVKEWRPACEGYRYFYSMLLGYVVPLYQDRIKFVWVKVRTPEDCKDARFGCYDPTTTWDWCGVCGDTSALPALVFVRNGGVLERYVSIGPYPLPPKDILQFLDRNLARTDLP